MNVLLIFGFLLFPTSDLPNMPLWLSKIDLYITVIFIVPLTYQLIRVFQKTGIKISQEGIAENILRHKNHQYEWSTITKIGTLKIFFWRYLLVYIANPKDYIKQQNIFFKMTSFFNFKRYGTPIKVPIHNLNTSFESLIAALSEHARGTQ